MSAVLHIPIISFLGLSSHLMHNSIAPSLLLAYLFYLLSCPAQSHALFTSYLGYATTGRCPNLDIFQGQVDDPRLTNYHAQQHSTITTAGLPPFPLLSNFLSYKAQQHSTIATVGLCILVPLPLPLFPPSFSTHNSIAPSLLLASVGVIQ